MRGLADGLDPDSAYLNAKQLAERRIRSRDAGGRRRHRADAPVLPARDRRARRIAGRQGRPADRRLRAGDRRQADARHVGVRRHAPAARPARIEGRADGHPRQRRGPARGVAGAREGGRAAGHRTSDQPGRADAPAAKSSNMVDLPLLSPETGYVRIASFRAGVVEDLRKQVADALEGGREIAHHRRAPHGRGAARERHRGGAPVRQVRHAGDQGGPQGRGERKPSRRAPATARSRSPSRSSSRPARPAPPSCSPRRSAATSARSSSASTRSAAPPSRSWSSCRKAAASG